MAHLLRARPRPDPARRRVPPAGRQDPGVRLPRRPPAHPPHPRPRGRPGRHVGGPGARASTSRSPRPSPSATTAATVPAATPARTPSSPYVDGGYDHAVWGADVTLAPLNLCAETLDGIRNHSWSRPGAATPEGEVVSWADRIAYVCHDFEDAVAAGIVAADMLPAGRRRAVRRQPLAAARRVHRGDGRRRRRDRPHRHDRAGRRGAGRVPPLQLRARLPAPGQPRPRPTPSSPLLRALVEHYADRPHLLPDPPARRPEAPTTRCAPRSPTSAG